MVAKESKKTNMLHVDIQLEEMELYKNYSSQTRGGGHERGREQSKKVERL